ncbi:hypothetical protein LXL04_026798 [Taraxacum kok-saghyz]
MVFVFNLIPKSLPASFVLPTVKLTATTPPTITSAIPPFPAYPPVDDSSPPTPRTASSGAPPGRRPPATPLCTNPSRMNGRHQKSDRISALPQDTIEKILTLIPIRDAVRTSILSTKWRGPILEFYLSVYKNFREIDQITLHLSRSNNIKKFTLNIRRRDINYMLPCAYLFIWLKMIMKSSLGSNGADDSEEFFRVKWSMIMKSSLGSNGANAVKFMERNACNLE